MSADETSWTASNSNMPELDLTVLCRVRNEECFIRAAILSVLPLAKRVLVYDTGSTDRTVEEVLSIPSKKIDLVVTKTLSPLDLTRLRNTMQDQATTEWCMLVDGDEVYPRHAIDRIRDILPQVPPNIHRIVVNRRHFVASFNFVSGIDCLARIYRRAAVRHGTASPKVAGAVGHETPYLVAAPQTPWREFSLRLPRDVWFFHCQYLTRSSKDRELGRLRGWRKPKFPVWPYLGPWPEGLSTAGLAPRVTPQLLSKGLALNVRNGLAQCAPGRWSIPGLWRLKRWPPADLILPGALSETDGAPVWLRKRGELSAGR